MTIFTPSKLAQQSRRRDRQNTEISRVLAAMRRGACLHLSYAPRPHWRLSVGTFVTEEVAHTLINMQNPGGNHGRRTSEEARHQAS